MSNNSWDKDWLVFSRKSRRGIFVLLFIFIIVAVAPRMYRNYFVDNSVDIQISTLGMNTEETTVKDFNNKANVQGARKKDQTLEAFTYNIPQSPFNPNTYTFEEWKAIGFSDKQVQTIMKYRQSGGEFKIKEDVKKLYVIDDKLYSKLYEVIDLPDTISSSKKSKFITKKSTEERIIVNVNTCTLEELKKVSGIGPFFAEEIIKLREGYGGIHDLNQLLEIYRMDKEKLSTIRESLIVESGDIKKLNINTASRKELNRHKEISWNIANSIVSMREKHGEYKKLDDLLKSILIDQNKLEALKPYLTIE